MRSKPGGGQSKGHSGSVPENMRYRDEPEREDVGAKGRLAHGLLGGEIADGPRPGGFECVPGHPGDAEIGEPQMVTREEDESFPA